MANVEEKAAVKITSEMVAEARVARIVAEEEQLTKTKEDIKLLELQTNQLLGNMERAREQGEEEVRRKYRNEVVVMNLRLVTAVLQKYGYFSQDKFQNGCVGLLRAAETYSFDKIGSRGTTVPFKNYACFCIETEVRLAYARSNRKFEGKNARFLDSIDAPSTLPNGDQIEPHDIIGDEYAEMEFDAILEQAETYDLFYKLIIPTIEEYGKRSLGIDMELWKELEIQYFMELSMEDSRRQRLTFTEMAKQLGTTPQNLRVRHKKVVQKIRARCEAYGYYLDTNYGKARVRHDAAVAVAGRNARSRMKRR